MLFLPWGIFSPVWGFTIDCKKRVLQITLYISQLNLVDSLVCVDGCKTPDCVKCLWRGRMRGWMEDSGAGGARCIVGEITRKPELKVDLSHFLSEENKGCLLQRERKTRNHLHIRSSIRKGHIVWCHEKQSVF